MKEDKQHIAFLKPLVTLLGFLSVFTITVSAQEINGNGIDDDGDCQTDCDDMLFSIQSHWQSNGMDAGFVIGQNDFLSNTSGTSPTKFTRPNDIAVDPTTNKVFVSDAANNRVLRYANYHDFLYEKQAESVLGQVDFVTNVSSTSSSGFNSPVGIFVDHNGVLWVCDYDNNRVLRFDDAANKIIGASADGVLGQVNFTNGLSGIGVNRLNQPVDVVVDTSGTLYVADQYNGRVLRFDNAASLSNGDNAAAVIGAPNFTDNGSAVTQTNLTYPTGIELICNTLYISDIWADRILAWENPAVLANGAPADRVLGQIDFISSSGGTAANKLRDPRYMTKDSKNNLYVSDAGNNRVLVFYKPNTLANGSSADLVLGQNSFTANAGGLSVDQLTSPRGILVHDEGARTFVNVVDRLNNRIMVFGHYNYQVSETNSLVDFLPMSYLNNVGGVVFSLLTQPSRGVVTLTNSVSGAFQYQAPSNPCLYDEDYSVTFVYQISNAVGCSVVGEIEIEVLEAQGCIEDCTNGTDDDFNGFIDVEDPMCDNDGDGVVNGQDIDLDNDGVVNVKEQYMYGGLGFCLNTITSVLLFEDFGVGVRGESAYIPMCFEHGGGSGVTCSSHYDSNTYSASVDWGEYCLVKNSFLADQGVYNWDYTIGMGSVAGGRFAIVNGGNENQVVYERLIDGLVIGVRLKVDLKFKNLSPVGSNLAKPKFHFEYWSESGVLLFTSSTITPAEDGVWHGGGSGNYICAESKIVFKMVLEAAALPGNDLAFDKLNVFQKYVDCDNDGVPNIYDLDNDNDGITNIVEQGNPDADGSGTTDNVNGDGSLMNDANNNGADDAYEGQVLLDTDGDHLRDMFDLDSDNDGIYDVLEAGGADPDYDGIIGAGAFVDADGDGLSSIVDADDSGVPLLNKDSDTDGIDDAKEIDSDNDGCFDVQEAGFPDTDNNGLLGVGATGTGLNVNGQGVVTP